MYQLLNRLEYIDNWVWDLQKFSLNLKNVDNKIKDLKNIKECSTCLEKEKN